MSWDDPFYTGNYANSWAEPDEPYDTMKRTQTRTGLPEGGLRYEQQGIPAKVDAPGCTCANCPWRANVESGRAAVALPTTSIDRMLDNAYGAQMVEAARQAMAVAAKESMTAGSPFGATREVSIIPQTLDLTQFLMVFIFIVVVYLCISFSRQLGELRRAVGVSEA